MHTVNYPNQKVRKALIIASAALTISTPGAGFSAPARMDTAQADGSAFGANRSTIILFVDNFRSAAGQVCFALFPEGGDLSEPETAVHRGCSAITTATSGRLKSEIRIDGVPFGSYALAVFHDKNVNNVMDTRRFFGYHIPTEDFGFSNNPRLGSSGPSLDDALFQVNSSFFGLGILLRKPPL